MIAPAPGATGRFGGQRHGHPRQCGRAGRLHHGLGPAGALRLDGGVARRGAAPGPRPGLPRAPRRRGPRRADAPDDGRLPGARRRPARRPGPASRARLRQRRQAGLRPRPRRPAGPRAGLRPGRGVRLLPPAVRPRPDRLRLPRLRRQHEGLPQRPTGPRGEAPAEDPPLAGPDEAGPSPREQPHPDQDRQRPGLVGLPDRGPRRRAPPPGRPRGPARAVHPPDRRRRGAPDRDGGARSRTVRFPGADRGVGRGRTGADAGAGGRRDGPARRPAAARRVCRAGGRPGRRGRR